MRVFLIRGLVAITWAVVFATVSDSLTVGAGILLVVYPLIDAVASFIDAREQGGSARRVLLLNGAGSAVAAVALAVAATGTVADVFVVFGLWAAVSGAAQFITAIRRRAQFGSQWPMLLAGAVSVLAGVAYIVGSGGSDPQLAMIALYAAAGGVDFVIQAGLLARRRHRLATVTA